MSGEERQHLVEHILDIDKRLDDVPGPVTTEQWLNIDLTMPQLKILFLLYTRGAQSMGQLAKPLSVKLSTVTGIVDRLIERQLVTREEDPHDRRMVVTRLTDKGHQIVDTLYQAGRIHMANILDRLTLDELRIVAQALDIIQTAALADPQARNSMTQGEPSAGILTGPNKGDQV